jgi:alpha-L-rhamnosidase
MLDDRVAPMSILERLPFFRHTAAFALCFAALALCSGQTTSRDALTEVFPTQLRCEYLKDPMGLDVSKPRLGWKTVLPAESHSGQQQAAWHVLVASKREFLEADRGDLWDSGWVKSGQSQQVEYDGKPLRPGQTCWWKVRVRMTRGGETAWSTPARWSMGILQSQGWTAKWIGTDMIFERRPGLQDNALPDPWLRKTFTLGGGPDKAAIHVASVGYHEVYVNGQRAGEAVLAPCATDHTKRARYVSYDITGLLRPGKNALVIWLGFSWSIFPPYQTSDKPASPIVLAQADMEWADGKTLRVATDETWKWHPSPNTTIGLWDFMNFGGERYDANKEVKGWAEPDLDDSGWSPVKTFSPALQVSAQRVEPNRKIEEIRPVSIEEVGPNVWRIDMGLNFTGYLEAEVAGDPGDVVEFKWSEMKDKEMTHKLHSFYVIGPGGRGTFRNRFNYGVGRWIQVHGLKKRPELQQVRGWFIRTGYERAAEFRCSNALLNRIFETTVWTYENLSLGGYVVDCAQRERMGYGGDAHATTATAMDVFKTAALYFKWAEDWRDVQGKSAAWGVGKKADELGSGKSVEAGNLPYTAPTYWGGGGPGWSGYCVTLPWEMYTRYGDTRILEQMFPTIEAWLGFVETKVKSDLLRRYGGEWDFLGDWLWPGAQGVNGDTRETLFFNNCYWVYNLETAANIATALGRKEQARKWQLRAEVVRDAIHKEFYDPATQTYVDGSQACLAIALLTQVPPLPIRSLIAKRLEEEILVKRQGHWWAGIGGGAMLMKWLIQANRPDLVYTTATKEDYPSWGHMLKEGATTIWEDWEGKLSQSHSSYLYIGGWFIEGLAGIRPGVDGDGYKHFLIVPGVWKATPLEWVNCRFDSPYGIIESSWKRESGKTTYTITVPPNTTATAWIPASDATDITAEGKPAAQVKGVRVDGNQAGRVLLNLQPGTYRLESSGVL